MDYMIFANVIKSIFRQNSSQFLDSCDLYFDWIHNWNFTKLIVIKIKWKLCLLEFICKISKETNSATIGSTLKNWLQYLYV